MVFFSRNYGTQPKHTSIVRGFDTQFFSSYLILNEHMFILNLMLLISQSITRSPSSFYVFSSIQNVLGDSDGMRDGPQEKKISAAEQLTYFSG